MARANSNRQQQEQHTLRLFCLAVLPTGAERRKQVIVAIACTTCSKASRKQVFPVLCLDRIVSPRVPWHTRHAPLGPLPNVAAAGDRPVVIVVIDAADGERDKISRGVCKSGASILSRTNDATVMW